MNLKVLQPVIFRLKVNCGTVLMKPFCFSCFKDCESVPGLPDYSPEELRYLS